MAEMQRNETQRNETQRKLTWEQTKKFKKAIKTGDEKTIRKMIKDESIDVNADICSYWLKTWEKKRVSTALHYAVKNNNLYIIKVLVELGAEITKTDWEVDYSKKTPLERAVDKNKTSIVCYFVNTCQQDISNLSEDCVEKIHKMVEECGKNNPFTKSQYQELGESFVVERPKREAAEKKYKGMEDAVEQIQNISHEEINADKEILEKRCQELEESLVAERQKREAAEKKYEDMEDSVEKMWNIPREEITCDEKILGTGAYGYVKVATFRGREVVAKFLHKSIVSSYNKKQFAKEKKIFARCRHKNLVEFIGAVPDHPTIIVIEKMDFDLRSALHEKMINLKPLPICVDVAEGLKYLHGIQPDPVIHRDVSAANVLLKAVGTGWIAKLCDLGSAQFANIATTFAPGAAVYAAPEVLDRESALFQTVKIDVYSYGVLLIEILTKKIPEGNLSSLIDSLKSKSSGLVPLIQQCTSTKSTERPTMIDVMILLKNTGI